MNDIAVFVAEVLASLFVSAFIVFRIKELLRRIGTEACERAAGSTDFWVTFVQLMMFIAPLILVAFISRAGSGLSPVAQLKSSLMIVLSGQFLGLVLVGRAVWKSIVVPAREDALLTAIDAATGANP